MNYGKGKISNRYGGKSIQEDIKENGMKRRRFNGELVLQDATGLTLTQHIENNTDETIRAVLWGGQFKELGILNTALNESVDLILGQETLEDVVVKSPEKLKAVADFFNNNPTRIARLEVMVDSNHLSQMNNNIHIAQYHPAKGLSDVELNLVDITSILGASFNLAANLHQAYQAAMAK
jgi:hypothetical protein